MFLDDHKKIATIMVSKRNHKGEQTMSPTAMKPEVSKTEDGEVDERHVAAQDLLAAFHEKSAQRLSEAMSNFIDIHHSKLDSGASPSEE